MIAVTPDGQRSMNTYLGACREMTPDDVQAEEIADAKILYIEGYLWDKDDAKDAARKAIAARQGRGRRVALSLSDSFCVGRFRDEFLELMHDHLDILFANEDEALALFEVESFDTVVEKRKAWGGIAAVTRSAKGCVVDQGQRGRIPCRRRRWPRWSIPPARATSSPRVSLWPDPWQGPGRLRPAGAPGRSGSDFALWRAAGNVAEGTGEKGRPGLIADQVQ